CGIALSRRSQMRLNAGVWRFSLPELYLLTFALLVVTDHELPEQIVQRLMLECILCGRDTKRDMIRARKRPRVANPSGQKRHHCRRNVVSGQRSAITKSHFHI